MKCVILVGFYLLFPFLLFSQSDSIYLLSVDKNSKNKNESFEKNIEQKLQDINQKLQNIMMLIDQQKNSKDGFSNSTSIINGPRDSVSKDRPDKEKPRKFIGKIEQLELDTATLKQSNLILVGKVNSLQSLVSRVKSDSITSNIKSFENGKADILNQLANFYVQTTFDNLLLASTPAYVSRDLVFLASYPEAKKILLDLDLYFKIQTVLTGSYDKTKVDIAVKDIKDINQVSTRLNDARINLNLFRGVAINLNKAIREIINYDEQMLNTRLTQQLQDERFKFVIEIISKFIFENEQFARFSSLEQIVFQIIYRKKDNAEASIEDLLNKSID